MWVGNTYSSGFRVSEADLSSLGNLATEAVFRSAVSTP